MRRLGGGGTGGRGGGDLSRCGRVAPFAATRLLEDALDVVELAVCARHAADVDVASDFAVAT